MPNDPEILAPYGWNSRVRALLADALAAGLVPGRVVRPERSACRIVTPFGEQFAVGDPQPVAGDWVAVAMDCDPARIVSIAPRWSALTRLDPHGDRVQVLVADIDVVMITCPADRPSFARVERETVLAWESGARPLVVVTKSDLDREDLAGVLKRRMVGVDVITTSVVGGIGILEIRARLAPDRTAVMIGPSGAGKSTLINTLVGAPRLETGTVRDADKRGRHTTTSRELVVIPSGGVIIDTPGLRSLGLPTGDLLGLEATFPDVMALAARCRFRDCAHDEEPECGVRAAVEDGTLDPDRFASFVKLERELAYEARRTDPVAARQERDRWKAIRKAYRRDPRHR